MRLVARSPEETQDIAGRLARRSRPGDVLCLRGPLGSGKTTFVRGFARALGCRKGVASPSFGLVREYRAAGRRICHADLFRVAGDEIADLGLEEYLLEGRWTCLIEWPQAARALLPDDRLDIRFLSLRRGAARSLRISGCGRRAMRLLTGAGLP
ncbi:MAG: tRNA (adenosine(37)-N6)-threonylcarbamoyltransferase complex ATPase subunit type 1 TsaE [Elusimicrobia bacterium]|nr:tRNA (adenosine(37)-N6)-threonylcarbamoyltransferase complex ATPase subunit type 1 TsaE [Elusimicrobiota bacterium]